MGDKGNLSDKQAKRAKIFGPHSNQQAQIIASMMQVRDRIPKDLEKFEKFVNELVDWHPLPHVVFSVWNKMRIAEEKTSGKRIPTPVITLSDDEDNSNADDCVLISDSPPRLTGTTYLLSNELEIYAPRPQSPEIVIDPLATSGFSEIIEGPITLPEDCVPDIPLAVSLYTANIPGFSQAIQNNRRAIPEVSPAVPKSTVTIPDGSLQGTNTIPVSGGSQATGSGTIWPVEEKKPRRTWYLPPDEVDPNTSSKTASKNSPRKRRKKNLKSGANDSKVLSDEKLKTEDLKKEDISQLRKRKGKPTAAVPPIMVAPVSTPGSSQTQSSKRKVEPVKGRQTRTSRTKKVKDEPMTEEQTIAFRQCISSKPVKGRQTRTSKRTKKVEDEPMTEEQEAMALRQRLLVDKVIELELPKILQDQTGSNISESVVRAQLLKALRSV